MLLTAVLQQALPSPIPAPNEFGGGLIGAVAYIIISVLILVQTWQALRARRLERQWEEREKDRDEEVETERKRFAQEAAERSLMINELIGRANRLDETQTSLRIQIGALTAEVNAEKQKNTGLQQRVTELERGMSEAKQQIERDAAAHKDAIAALRTKYEEQIAELRTQLQQQKNIVASRDIEIAALTETHATENKRRDQIEALLRKERDTAQEHAIALEAQIVTLTEQLSSAIRQLEQAQARVAELEAAQQPVTPPEISSETESEPKEEKPDA